MQCILRNQMNACKGFCSYFHWLVFQVQTDVGVDTKHQTLQGVAFPIAKEAIQALEKLRNKELNYVQLASIRYFRLFLIIGTKYLHTKQCVLMPYTDKLPFCTWNLFFLPCHILSLVFCVLTVCHFSSLTGNWYEKRNYYSSQHTSYWT